MLLTFLRILDHSTSSDHHVARTVHPELGSVRSIRLSGQGGSSAIHFKLDMAYTALAQRGMVSTEKLYEHVTQTIMSTTAAALEPLPQVLTN